MARSSLHTGTVGFTNKMSEKKMGWSNAFEGVEYDYYGESVASTKHR